MDSLKRLLQEQYNYGTNDFSAKGRLGSTWYRVETKQTYAIS